jgi:hypothetical protein
MAFFHAHGHLSQAMVSRVCTLQGHAFDKGDVLLLYPESGLELGAKRLGKETRVPLRPP